MRLYHYFNNHSFGNSVNFSGKKVPAPQSPKVPLRLWDEELVKVMAAYGDTDLQQYKLEAQLSLLPEVVQAMGYDTSRFDIADLLDFYQSLGNNRKLPLSEICTLGKLMLVMPATNAVSERSFSAFKRVKTHLRSTTGEGRLNHLMLLHVHKELADGIDMVEVANLFVGDNKELIGKFSKNDVCL